MSARARRGLSTRSKSWVTHRKDVQPPDFPNLLCYKKWLCRNSSRTSSRVGLTDPGVLRVVAGINRPNDRAGTQFAGSLTYFSCLARPGKQRSAITSGRSAD